MECDRPLEGGIKMVRFAQLWRRRFTSPGTTILIAEPDPMLRRLERRALSPKYQIVETSSAEEAVRTAARREANLDLLLTEVRFPRIDGWDLAELLKLDYPALKVVYLSRSIDAEVRAHTRRSTVIVLEKDRFRPDCLRKAVRDVLVTGQKDRTESTGTTNSLFSGFRRRWAKLHLQP
jgi:CheY-like chemotaxis protein